MSKIPLSLLTGMALLLSACGSGTGEGSAAVVPPGVRNESACRDFYAYANADWLSVTPYPFRGAITLSTPLARANQQALLAELARPGGSDGLPPPQAAVLDLLASRADRAAVERAGLTPLSWAMDEIDSLQQLERLPVVWGRLLHDGVRLPVALAFVSGASPLLPDILQVGPEAGGPPVTTAGFEAYVGRMLALLGRPVEEAAVVVAIERALVAAPPAEGPVFDLPALLAAAGMPPSLPNEIDAASARRLAAVRQAFDAPAWRAFMRWRVARSFADRLPAAFAAERDGAEGFSPETFAGSLPIEPEIEFLAAVLPHPLDVFYAARLLPAATANRTRQVAGEIRTALHRQVDSRAWLGADSRAAAHALVDSVELVLPTLYDEAGDRATAEVALPTMRRDALLDNVRLAARYDLDRRFALALASRSDLAAGGDAWWRQGAAYRPERHRVVIAPAMVQALQGLSEDDAGRYGALGTVVAGRLLQALAVPATWIDPADATHYDRMLARLRSDYAGFVGRLFQETPAPERPVAEDFSDLGGVAVALAALKQVDAGADAMVFFGAFAAVHRTRQSEEDDLASAFQADGTALYSYRVNGPLTNLPAFASTFTCAADDAMVRSAEARVDLW